MTKGAQGGNTFMKFSKFIINWIAIVAGFAVFCKSLEGYYRMPM